jgi:hypothetical protein
MWERRGEYRRVEDKRGKVRKWMDVPLHIVSIDVLAWLGLKAMALAWPEEALALLYFRPSQSCQPWLGPGLAYATASLICDRQYISYVSPS